MNIFVSLPVPVSNGVGAAVDVTTMGLLKTILVTGTTFQATVTVEVSEDGVIWSPLASFLSPDVHDVEVAACWLRVKIDGHNGGPLPLVGVGSTGTGTKCVSLPVPVADGVGAAVDVSTFGSFKTFIVGPSVPEDTQVTIEGSEDGVNFGWRTDFIQADHQDISTILKFVRVRLTGYTSGALPLVGMAAVNDPTNNTPVVQVVTDSACIAATTTVVRFNTIDNEPQLYLPSVADGDDGRQIVFEHTDGMLDAILLPDSLTEGVDGLPGASYTFPALDQAATFQADVANNIWRKISGNP